MRHYLKSENGEVKCTVDMYCGHPYAKDYNTRPVSCNCACSKCMWGIVTLSVEDFYEIMKYAKLTSVDK